MKKETTMKAVSGGSHHPAYALGSRGISPPKSHVFCWSIIWKRSVPTGTDKRIQGYVLDGQTAILEDYFAVKTGKQRPCEETGRSRGKLIIYPWYTQTDTTIVESIVRNLMYGMRDCLAFGEPIQARLFTRIPLACPGKLPHIYNGFGITRTMFCADVRSATVPIKPSFCGKGR